MAFCFEAHGETDKPTNCVNQICFTCAFDLRLYLTTSLQKFYRQVLCGYFFVGSEARFMKNSLKYQTEDEDEERRSWGNMKKERV